MTDDFPMRRAQLIQLVRGFSSSSVGDEHVAWSIFELLLTCTGFFPDPWMESLLTPAFTAREDWYDTRIELPSETLDFLESIAPSGEVAGRASHAHPKDPDRRMRMSWSKLLRKVNHVCREWLALSDAVIDTMQAKLTNALDTEGLEFELVSGRELARTYDEEYFNSCMHESPEVRLYSENPEAVECLRVMRDGKLIGRALVWQLANYDNKYLDRVYPSNGGQQISAAVEYARQRGWYYRTGHHLFGEWEGPHDMQVRLKDVDAYPYMDTFAEVVSEPDDDGYFVLQSTTDEDITTFRSTDGELPWRGRVVGRTHDGTPVTSVHVERGEARLLPTTGLYAWTSDIVQVYEVTVSGRRGDYLGEYDMGDDMVVSVYDHEEVGGRPLLDHFYARRYQAETCPALVKARYVFWWHDPDIYHTEFAARRAVAELEHGGEVVPFLVLHPDNLDYTTQRFRQARLISVDERLEPGAEGWTVRPVAEPEGESEAEPEAEPVAGRAPRFRGRSDLDTVAALSLADLMRASNLMQQWTNISDYEALEGNDE